MSAQPGIAIVAIAVALFTTTVAGVQEPTRPGRQSAAAQLAGVVLSATSDASPLRFALVSLKGPEVRVARTIVADDDGRFVFSNLPAGRYELSATKAGYLTTSYGARAPGRRGTLILLADGEHRGDLRVRVFRGAVITGTVFNSFGEAAPRQHVTVLRRRMTEGGRTLVPVAASSAAVGDYGPWTDDRGVYRLYGLPPGEYLVAAKPPAYVTGATFRETSAADVARATRLLKAGPSGSVGPDRSGVTAEGDKSAESVSVAPIYYPGTLIVSNAVPVAIAAGEQRTGIDIQLEFGRAVTVEGTVTDPLGRPATGVVVHVVSNEPEAGSHTSSAGLMSPGGRFRLGSLIPGRYLIEARTVPPTAAGGSPDLTEFRWAATEIEVSGMRVPDVALTLQPGVTVSGVVVSDRAPGVVLSQPVTEITLKPEHPVPGSWFSSRPFTVIAREGRFTFPNVAAGRYRISADPQNVDPTRGHWHFTSALIGGRDAADTPGEIRVSESASNVVVTLTERGTELSGTLLGAAGQPAATFSAIVFSTDRSTWFWESRRVRVVSLDNNAGFLVRGLPPGDYFVSVVTDVEPGEQFDPAFLDQLVPASVKIQLRPGEKTVQSIRIAR